MASEWTTDEELILVAAIASIEADWLAPNFSSSSFFQQWEILVGKCSAMGVRRNLYQLRAKWTSLLSDYNLIREWNSMAAGDHQGAFDSYWYLGSETRERFGLPERFDDRVFTAIDDYVRFLRPGGSGRVPDPDPKVDASDQAVAAEFFVEIPGPEGDPLLQDLEAELYHQEAALEGIITHQPEPEYMEEINPPDHQEHQTCQKLLIFTEEEEGRHCWEKMECVARAEEVEAQESHVEEEEDEEEEEEKMQLGEQRRYNRGRKPKALVEEEKMADRVYETAQLMLAIAKGDDDDGDDRPPLDEEDGDRTVGRQAEKLMGCLVQIVDILERYPYLVQKYS